MIDLTPLDIRNKRGDFRKGMRGYDPQEVDHFLEMAADRLDELVRENLTLNERVSRLSDQVSGQEGRERAVQEALVTAQELREEIRDQARREADLIRREAEEKAARIVDAAERAIDGRRHELDELNRSRGRFLRAFRTLLERELDAVRVEEERPILEDLDLDALEVFAARDRAVKRRAAGEAAAATGSSEPDASVFDPDEASGHHSGDHDPRDEGDIDEEWEEGDAPDFFGPDDASGESSPEDPSDESGDEERDALP